MKADTIKRYKDIIEFIGDKAQFDEFGAGYIWGVKGEDQQMIGEVRGWGAIQNLFRGKDGAEDFQDRMGRFIAEAITEKIEREKSN